LLAELLAALATLFTAFTWAEFVAWFLRLFAAGGAIIVARRTVGIAGLTIFMTLRTEIRAALVAGIGAGGRLVGLATDLPALGWSGFFLGGKDLQFSFGFYDRLRGGRVGYC
jgi:hypothetical protein